MIKDRHSSAQPCIVAALTHAAVKGQEAHLLMNDLFLTGGRDA